MSIVNKSSEIAIHTLPNPTDENVANFTGSGVLVEELAELGYGTVFTDRNTFPDGVAGRAEVKADGKVVLSDAKVDLGSIGAMRTHPIASINNPVFQDVPKLNSNALKKLAGDKFELYKSVLSGHQPETHLVSMAESTLEEAAGVIHSIATDDVVLKSNGGYGGASTMFLSKEDAVAWLADQIDQGSDKKMLVQPKVAFGKLPDGIKGTTDELDQLVSRARREDLLTELRIFALKRKGIIETFPILRIVPDKALTMSGTNDDYVEVDLPEELLLAVHERTSTIIESATSVSGDDFAIGAVDYYFDVNGLPHVMEANLRSPQIPGLGDLPSGNRGIYKALAATLVSLANSKDQ